VSSIAAALRITWDALLYRVRKRELNNLPVTISLMAAFALPLGDVAYRATYSLLLNVFVYLLNDLCDIEVDLASPQKDQPKTRFLAEHRRAAAGALVGLGVLLLLGGLLHSALLTAAFCFNATVILLYSAWLKRQPIFDILMMVLWGAGMAAVGAPGTALGWKLIGLLALLCASFEAIQIVRDEPDDRAAGVTSTAVLLGTKRVAWIYRGIVVASATYGMFFVGSPLALILALGAALPLDPARANRTWDLVRALFGTAWLALLAQVYLGYLPA
jgi:4-hydroxybenzoate polyprenyltransferase